MTTRIYYNPLSCSCKNIIGAIAQGDLLQLNVFSIKETSLFDCNQPVFFPDIEDCYQPKEKAYLRINKDGENSVLLPMKTTPFGWTIQIKINEIGLYFYSFAIENTTNVSCGLFNLGFLSERIESFLLTVHSKDYQTPDWFKGGVMYQIFPDRFCRKGTMSDIIGRITRDDWRGIPSYRPNKQGKILNNDFFGGNFKGIESKLPYLHELGITTIYLNPIFEAASNHRYDTSNYMNLDPFLGTEKEFSELLNSAEKYGIRFILDGVFNHTGDDSVYFNKYGRYSSVGAYQSKESPYYDWYSFQEFPNKYSSWWGIDILPEINESSKEYRNFIFGKDGVLKKWLSFGIGGYRLDVADELPDFFLKELRTSVKETNPNAIIIGEVWEDASNKIAYETRREYLQGYELDSVMNYPLKNGIIRYLQTGNASELLHTIRVLIDHYPKQTLDCLMNILGTHDTPRILTVLGGIQCNNKEEMATKKAYLTAEKKEVALKKLKIAAVLQYTLPGVPCLYYGDENGMEGHIDPFCRQCFDWEQLDQNLIQFYSKLGEIRKKHCDLFKDGDFKELYIKDGLLYFKRTKSNREIFVCTNYTNHKYLIQCDGEYYDEINNQILKNEIVVQENSFAIFTKII